MTEAELIFTTLAELSTRQIAEVEQLNEIYEQSGIEELRKRVISGCSQAYSADFAAG